MLIQKYGLKLKRLQEGDIELVRHKRNKKYVAERMFYQKHISADQQKKWFQSINNKYNYYFLIEYKGEKVGMIHGKVLSYDKRIAEGGMFIWESKYKDLHLPIMASVCLADITFLIMKMKTTKAEVRSDNQRAIDYNLKLGYEIVEEIDAEKKLKMELTRDNYFEKAAPIRQMVKKISRDKTDISWDDIQLEPERSLGSLYIDLPSYLQKEVNKKRSQ